jgi:beta-lactamase class A
MQTFKTYDKYNQDLINQSVLLNIGGVENTLGEECRLLNLHDTKLNRKLMDFDALKSGADIHISAADAVNCLKAIDNKDLFQLNTRKSTLRILHNQQFCQKLLGGMNRNLVYTAYKTGELPGVEHDCAIMRYKHQTIYAAVLIDKLLDNSSGNEMMVRIGQYLNEFILND